ncbi:hypothetical protein F967_02185 [Acinetobacter sp. CIP 102637]|uniref:DUF6160 family protein n=1 Tax=Acinetobacter sp. CIP 102637 TaxID=1144669 RepID=UPI0002CE179D|nr:hypothetical protein F967_02185 [Acinetobacter sp. CIP 102637]
MQKQKNIFLLSILSSSILMSMHSAHALQVMTDSDLRAVNAQDGVHAEVSYDALHIDQIYWEDKAGNSTGTGQQDLRATLNDVNITRGTLPTSQNLGVITELKTTSSGSKVGVDLNAKVTLGTIEVANTKFCKASGCVATDKTLGKLTLQSNDQNIIHLTTTDGLFSTTAQGTLELGFKNLNIGLTQKQDASTLNTLLMQNFNFNFKGLGQIYVDNKKGLILETGSSGYADFSRVDSDGDGNVDRPGLNLEFMLKDNAGVEKGLIRAGANGRMLNGSLQFRGVDDTEAAIVLGFANRRGTDVSGNPNIVATTNSIAGKTGMAFRLTGDFTNDQDNLGDNATTLELGGAGSYAYGLRFANITPLVTRKGIGAAVTNNTTTDAALNPDRAGLDTGNVYFNLVDARQIALPVSSRLTSEYLGNSANPLSTSADFIQTIAKTDQNQINPYSFVTSVRNMNFAALSRRGQFIATPDVTDASKLPSSTATKWGLGLPIYNLNANFALYGKTSGGAAAGDYLVTKNASTGAITVTPISGSERLGFSLAMSTEGVSSDGLQSTSIILIDGGDNTNYSGGASKPTDYYIGLRNIDMLLNGYGSIGFENSQFNVSLPKLLMVMSAQLAAGYLPGAKYKTCATNNVCYAPSNNFTLPNDILAGLKIRLGGSMNLALIPRIALANQSGLVDGVNRLNIVGIFKLDPEQHSSIQVMDPVDKSALGLDNMVGTLAFDNNLIVNKDSVGFNFGFNFNPEKSLSDVFRVKDVNFYPAKDGVVGDARRLGEMAITGGRLNSNMTIKPRDGNFVF